MEAPKIDLAISIQPSFIESKTFAEFIPLHYVEQLIKSPYLKDKWDLTNYSQKSASRNYINEQQQLLSFLPKWKKALKSFLVKYIKPKHKWGRVFPSKSLGSTSFAKRTRNTLIKKYYLDFDLSNAQPEILRNICVANNLPCETITKYCNEREQIIADIIKASGDKVDRALVKSLMISISFYGSFKGWLKENNIEPFPEPVIIADYCSEIRLITQIIKKKNVDMFKTIERNKKEKNEGNVDGAFLSTYLQEWELRIVENVLIHLCTETNICLTDMVNVFNAIYEFDGLKLFKESIEKYGGHEKLLELMNKLNLEFGFDIKWEIKPIEKFYEIEFIEPIIVDKEEEREQKKLEKDLEREQKKIGKDAEREQNKIEKEAEKKEKKKEAERLKELKELEKEMKKEENELKKQADFKAKIEKLKKEYEGGIADNDKHCADLIYNQIKENIVFSKKTLYYKNNYMWFSDERIIHSLLSIVISNSGIRKLNEDTGNINDYMQNRRNSQNVLQLIIDLAVSNANDDWANKMYKSSLGYILFKNGYYDFKKSMFIPFTSEKEIEDEEGNVIDYETIPNSLYDHSIIFMERIPYNFEMCEDKTYLKSVKQRMFIDPFGEEVADYYILNLARGLAGDCMKRVLFGIGDGNTGKSAMTTAVKSAIGGYFGTFNANNIAVKKIVNPDDAQSLRWVMLLVSKRIIVSNEIEPDVVINGSVLKKLSSGGKDDIVARGHQKNEEEYQISFLPIIFANDLDKISPMDDAIVNRVRAIPYEKIYVDEPKENDPFELKIDPKFDEEIQTDKFRNAFMLLLMKAYKKFIKNEKVEIEPPHIKKAILKTFGKVDTYIEKLENDFEITNDPEDYIESAVLIEWIKLNKLNISITKLGRDINKYCILKKFENVESKVKKISGKARQCWFGIKPIDVDDDDKDMC